MADKTAKPKKAAKQVEGNPLMQDGHAWDRSAVMAHICQQLATTAHGLSKILAAGCNGNPLPPYGTIDRWLTEDAELRERYARAKDSQADVLADEIVGLADDCTDHNKCRLQIDARKWVAAKLKPKKYGDRQQVDINDITKRDTGELKDRLTQLLGDGGGGGNPGGAAQAGELPGD